MKFVAPLLKAISVLSGLVLLYGAIFLYQDERLKIQNRLEEWWFQIDELRGTGLARSAALTRVIALRSSAIFSVLVGRRYLAIESLAACIAFALLSYVIYYIAFFATLALWSWRELAEAFDRYRPVYVRGFVGMIISAGIASLHFFGTKRYPQWSRYISLATIMLTIGAVSLLPHPLIVLTVFSISVCLACVCISLIRAMLSWAESTNSSARLAVVALSNSVIAFGVFVTPLVASQVVYSTGGSYVFARILGWTAMTNLLLALIAATFVFLLAIAVVHRLIWPLLSRVLYPLANDRVVFKRKTMATIGVALVGIGAQDAAILLGKFVP